MIIKRIIIFSLILMFSVILFGCGLAKTINVQPIKVEVVENASLEDMDLEYVNSAPGTKVEQNDKVTIDYSNCCDGYIMILCSENCENKIKAQVTGADDTYTYTIRKGVWETLPLSQGNGEYRCSIFENIQDTKYAQILTCSFSVSMNDEFGPFLRPNRYVDYSIAPNSVATARLLIADATDTIEKVGYVYDFVTAYLTYDKEKAKTVSAGYVPDMDQTLIDECGICFDYASLMTGMLRATGVPCKLVVGYAGDAYHAWISVWVDGVGWIDNIIYFDGVNWARMDPTFASTGGKSSEVEEFIGNGDNYIAKYYY